MITIMKTITRTMIRKIGVMKMKMKKTIGPMPGTMKRMKTMKGTMTTMMKAMTMTITAVAVTVSITGPKMIMTGGQAMDGVAKEITTGRPPTVMTTADQKIRGTEGITVSETEMNAIIIHPVGKAVETDPRAGDPDPAMGEAVPVVRAVPEIQDPAPAEVVQVGNAGMRRVIS